MDVRLFLCAEEISFDHLGRVSAQRMLMDVVEPSYPTTIPRLDLLSCWTRGPREPQESSFLLTVEQGGVESDAQTIPLDFRGRGECFQGMTLENFELPSHGLTVFKIYEAEGENRRELAKWEIRAHRGAIATTVPGQEPGEA